MRVMDGAGHRRHEPRRRARLAAKSLDLCGQIAAVDELHAEVMMAVVLADLVDRHDIRVIQVRGRLGLEPESLQIVRASRIGRRAPS